MHVHLRDGKMMELVVPTIRMGGVNTVCGVFFFLHWLFGLVFGGGSFFIGIFEGASGGGEGEVEGEWGEGG